MPCPLSGTVMTLPDHPFLIDKEELYMLIRPEGPADLTAIHDLVQAAFASAEHSDGTEQDFVLELRRRTDSHKEQAMQAIDRMLADPTTTYTEIAETMTARGFAISKSAIHRYAARMGADQQRLREIGEQTKRLVQSLKDNQDVEATEVANALLLDALTRRIATAEEEFDALPLDKAGRLLVSLQRSTVYKARTMEDKRRLVARMQDTFLSQLREQVRGDEELTRKLAELVAKAGQEALDAES